MHKVLLKTYLHVSSTYLLKLLSRFSHEIPQSETKLEAQH